MINPLRMFCLAIFLVGLGAGAEDLGDPNNAVGDALQEILAAKTAKSKASKTADQLLAFLPPVVATYNDKVATADEVRDLLRPKLQVMLQAAKGKLAEDEVKQAVRVQVNQMIDDEVIRLLAEKVGLKPDLDAARRKVGGNIEKNPLSETLFAAQGLSMAQTIKNQAFQQLREDWIKLVIEPKTTPTEEQILAFYEENFTHRDVPSSRDIYHILIKAESTDPAAKKAAARKKCAEILARVKAGEDFSELAKKFSDCPSKAKGGKLGIYEDDGSLVKEFTAVAFKMDEGAVSDVVETQFGYHIIKINKIIQAGRPPLDRVKPEIIEILSKKKANALIKQATEGVRQTMPININL